MDWGTGRRHSARAVARRASRLVADRPAPRVAVLGPAAEGLSERLRHRLPTATIVETSAAPEERHLAMSASGPFDLIVDRDVLRHRRQRFEDAFFHLAPGGTYLVPGGGSELGPAPGPLGALLQRCAALPATPLRQRLTTSSQGRVRAIRNHVSAQRVRGDLVLRHDLPDVFVKVLEESLDRLLERGHRAHRVLAVHPAATPEPPEVCELPEPRTRFRGLGLTAAPLSLREYHDVIAGPNQMLLSDGLVLPDSYRHKRATQQESKALVSLAPRFAVPLTELPADLPRLAGTFVHLDNEARGHFGHLIAESLSRVWTWPEALALDPQARVLVGATRKRPVLLDYELQIYEAAGVPRDRITLIDAPVRVERMIAGTPMVANPDRVHLGMAEIWQRVGDRLADQVAPRSWPRRIFVSRRIAKRSCLNGPAVEEVFSGHGFEIVYPEDYALGDQIQMFRSAEALAGYAGSGMFQLAFVPEPKRVIQIGSATYHPRNEFLIAAVRRHRLDIIVCRAEGTGMRADFVYDEQREGPHLRRLLAELADG